jgi:hypothetical protein
VSGADPSRTVLFVSDNGKGLGHVTRLMGIARQLPDGWCPVFLTLSEAHGQVRDLGFPVEYFPSRLRVRLMKTRWNALFSLRLLDVIERFRPSVVVVDHVAPPQAFELARDRHPEVAFVWSRRGLWRPGTNEGHETIRGWFDHVLEPGDVAAAWDTGPTAYDRDGVVAVPPITLLDRAELLPRSEARRELGLPGDGPAVLIALGADTAAGLERLIRDARDGADRAAPGTHLFALRHPLHHGALADVPGLTMRAVYPVARYLEAFDAVVTAAGYNTLHEVIRAGVPAIVVPRETGGVDHQHRRAEGAALRGAGVVVEDLTSAALGEAFRTVLAGSVGGLEDADARDNGARPAADWIRSLAGGARPYAAGPVAPPTADALAGARARLMSGWSKAPRDLPVTVHDATRAAADDVDRLVRSLRAEQETGATTKPVLVVRADDDHPALAETAVAYETCLSPSALALVRPDLDHEAYRQGRVRAVAEVFDAAEVREVGSARRPESPSGAGRAVTALTRRLRSRRG